MRVALNQVVVRVESGHTAGAVGVVPDPGGHDGVGISRMDDPQCGAGDVGTWFAAGRRYRLTITTLAPSGCGVGGKKANFSYKIDPC